MITSTQSFSTEQNSAIAAVQVWLKSDQHNKQVFRLFGYAGTGKTTIAQHLAANIDGEVVFGAFTGKAAMMMNKNGCKRATTLHNLLYRPRNFSNGTVTYVRRTDSPIGDAALVVIDECSMVNEDIARDLMSYRVPILVLGDPAQLPPPSGYGYFTDALPDVMLTNIHRQAAASPILMLGTAAREGRLIEPGRYGKTSVMQLNELDNCHLVEADQILVGTNGFRTTTNLGVRELKGNTSKFPIAGDKLICVRNDSEMEIFNGEMFVVEDRPISVSQGVISMTIRGLDRSEGGPFGVQVWCECFDGDITTKSNADRRKKQEFAFGYALTVHKAQGSQWNHILLIDQSHCFREMQHRWLYTAITRAAERLTLFI